MNTNTAQITCPDSRLADDWSDILMDAYGWAEAIHYFRAGGFDAAQLGKARDEFAAATELNYGDEPGKPLVVRDAIDSVIDQLVALRARSL